MANARRLGSALATSSSHFGLDSDRQHKFQSGTDDRELPAVVAVAVVLVVVVVVVVLVVCIT